MTESEDVSKRTTMEELVRTYMKAEADIRYACGVIAGACAALDQMVRLGETSGGVDFHPAHNRRLDYSNPEEAITELRRQIWRRLVERLELRRMMSVKRALELDKWLETPTVEPITLETVLGFSRYYTENLSDMLSEAVGEVYDFLRPAHSQLKTNTQYELKRRVILEGWVSTWSFSKSRFHPTSFRRPHMVALCNVLSALDGKGSISKSHYSDLEQAIEQAAVGETPYLRYKCFGNGNLHLEFKRPDLIKRFNALAGGRRLKPENAG